MFSRRSVSGLSLVVGILLLAGCGGVAFPNVLPYEPGIFADRHEQTLRRLKTMASELEDIPQGDELYRIHPSDVIEVKVFQYDKMDIETRVSMAGTINFPPLGEIKVAGLTQEELESRIEAGLEGRYLKQPNVIVFVREAESQNVTVMGEVQKPGQQAVWGETRLLDVLARAGGLTEEAGNLAYFIRRTPEGTTTVSTETAVLDAALPESLRKELAGAGKVVNPLLAEDAEKPLSWISQEDSRTFAIYLAGLLQRGEKEWNILLRPGDAVTISPAGTVHVTGPGIEKPGTYPLAFIPKTLHQVLDEAGGLKAEANRGIILMRSTQEEGKAEFFEVDWRQALQDRDYDVVMEPGDRLIVLSSTPRGLLDGVKRLLMTAAFRWTKSPNYSVLIGDDAMYK